MCGIVICSGCIDVSLDSFAIDTYVKWFPSLSISQGVDKVTSIFQFTFVGIFGLLLIELIVLYRFITEAWVPARAKGFE